MTYSDPPPPPPPSGGWNPPPGGWDQPPGAWGPGGTATAPKPAAPIWPIVVVTVLFSLFGLIPTIVASNRASDRRESSSRYWLTFVLSLLGSFVLYAVVFLLLAFVVLRSFFGFVDEAIATLPTSSFAVPTFPTPTPTTSASTAPAGTCVYTPDATGSAVALPDPDPSGVTATTWTLVTSRGTIVVALDATAAPCTVNSIVHLTQLGFYDNSPCPRSVNSGLSILQCGDPTGTGAGGPGYTFADEDLADADYAAGSVAMANSGPSTNGSQFFMTDRDQNTVLQKSYTVFGTITSGLDVLAAIIASGNDGGGDGRPTPPVTIVTATVS